MKKNKAPSFQFYPKDWLADATIMMMPPALEGAYIRLLCIAWDCPKCRLPNNDKVLGSLSRLGEDEWIANRGKFLNLFPIDPKNNDFLYSKRLRKERKKQEDWRRKSKQGGIKSGVSRLNRTKGGSTKCEPLPQPNPQPKGNTSSSFSSSISTAKDIISLTTDDVKRRSQTI